MPDPSPPRTARLLCGATLLALPYVFLSTFGRFVWFDDEGTLMIWFRSLVEGHRMYDEIYSLYGPLYSAAYGLAYAGLHVPLTHTAGRLIAAGLWLAYTAGFAALCVRLSRSLAAGAASYVLVLLWLTPLMNTPGHPEELGLVLMAAALLLAERVARRPGAAVLAGLGAVLAGLAMVKVNFGVFVGGGVVLALLGASAWRGAAALRVLLGAGLLLLPAGVMLLLAGQGWVRLYCGFATLTLGAALLVSARPAGDPVLRPADWAVLAGGGVLAAVLVLGGLVASGSSLGAILNAALFQNAHFIRNWYVPFTPDPQGLLACAASAAAAVAYRVMSGRPGTERLLAAGVVAVKAGCVAAGLLLMAWPGQPIRVLTPFCWLLLVPPPGVGVLGVGAPGAGRTAAGLVGAAMVLYAFPVGGGQVIIGGLVMVALLPLLARDALSGARALGWVPLRVLPPASVRGAVAAAAVALLAAGTLRSAWTYAGNVPLGLPGTALVRVDAGLRDDLRWATEQLSACPASYTMPGLLSFSFWTGHRTPTPVNANGILNFTSAPQQEAIVRALSAQPDVCVLFHPGLLHFFDRGQVAADPPLLHYVRTAFAPVAERHGYVLMRRP